jgi:capsular polysaccharide biosynthesis protein
MNWLRVHIQKWIDRKTQEVVKTNETLKEVITDLEQAKTIGELKERLERMEKREEDE